MKENNSDRRNRGRRRFRHDHDNAPRVRIPSMPCCICNEPIADMPNALAFGPDQGPAHFDCVLQELTKQYPLEGEEKLAYLGSGFFGIIVEKDQSHFEIHRKIPVEDPNNLPEWRKEIRNLYKNLS